MTTAQLYYLLNLLIYAGVDIIACLGLSQQFGVAGVTNFGFIIFQAAGAYTAAILSLPAAWKMMKPKFVNPATPNCWLRPRHAMMSTPA